MTVMTRGMKNKKGKELINEKGLKPNDESHDIMKNIKESSSYEVVRNIYSKKSYHNICGLSIYILGIVVRLFLYCYGIWQDNNLNVKFTDVDYFVYTDSAKYILEGKSPYERYTYRYTPLLAYLMIPNFILHRSFGKILFSVIDYFTSIIIIYIIKMKYPLCKNYIYYAALWILNPLVIIISIRGNADSIPCLLVVLTLFFIYKQKIIFASIFYGLSVTFKLYPIIYALPLMLYLNKDYLNIDNIIVNKKQETSHIGYLKNMFLVPARFFLEMFKLNLDQFLFAFLSFSTFMILNALFYKIYGYEFLYESYIYHLVRRDHRHNFSLFFYIIYLSIEKSSKIIPLITFFPQMFLVILLGAKYAKTNLELSMFLQTVVFIAMNKVCTSQYFIWWMPFLPIILCSITLNKENLILITIVVFFFILAKGHWLLWAYYLEFYGYNTFMQLFFASILFVISEMSICWSFMYMHFKERQTEMKKVQ